ncbi:MAG: preprotein translocase subunit SecY [Candidatus Eremiobacteraeota bacterium]|nr:preprotein translocase subunit SecY [Candidatus Eremiobacteraeota bacterium]MBV8369308.1 preprotein translocase subunit SecY [Candidatus Eremiobacteraeota bacterium]
MLNTLRNALTVPDIRKRIGFVFLAFAVFVFMIHVQLPNVNQQAWNQLIQSGAFYQFLGFLSGGALQKLSIIAMGITPYINASIIMQLMTVVIPQLEEMAKKGGEEGRKKISRYTRWLTIVLAAVQATSMAIAMNRGGVFYDHSWQFVVYAVIAFVSGTMFLMWLGEQITDKGIGNGISLIIFVGIVLRFPTQVSQTFSLANKGNVNWLGLALWIAIALVTIVSIVFMYQGQRRVPVQQARRVIGRKMYAGRSSYIPLRLNNAGVISIIFAISILLLPQQALSWFGGARGDTHTLAGQISFYVQTYFGPSSFLYNAVYFLLVVIFTFFYSAIVVNTKDIADNLKKSGSFIPGIRPGQPTVDYINKILARITTAAAVYLGLLAVLPSLQRDVGVTSLYIGSTSLLIVVGVALDSITQIEARLAMRDYRGFINR